MKLVYIGWCMKAAEVAFQFLRGWGFHPQRKETHVGVPAHERAQAQEWLEISVRKGQLSHSESLRANGRNE